MSTPLAAAPLTAEAFAPFGDVLEVPTEPGRRTYFDRALANLRPAAPPSLSLILAAPVAGRPVPLVEIERHVFSSQSFVPLAACRWLVLVAPHGADGGPDLAAARAFLPGPGQGITLKADTWHAPLTVLDTPAPFAIFMWRDWTVADEEIRPMAPLLVAV